MPPPTVPDAVEEIRGLIDYFDDMRTDQMTDVFYVRSYNLLLEAARDLIAAVDAQAGS